MIQNREMCWPRLESVIKWSNMSTNHFARHIGLLRGENLYQIKRGNNGISRKLAEMIVQKFPEINLTWIISGEGDMLREESNNRPQIDLYDGDMESEIRKVERLEPKERLTLPSSIDSDFAMIYRGGAMSPMIPTNTTVFLKKIETEMIIPGKEYLVQTRGIVALRTIRLMNNDLHDGMLRLVACNKEQYDDIFIEREQIERVYKVVAKLIINN